MEHSFQAAIDRQNLIEDWARYTAERLQKSIDKYKIGVTGDLKYSILYHLVGSGADITSVQHQFNYYGKFVDMAVGRGQKLESVKGNREMYSIVGLKGRKVKKWFTKTYYSESLELINLLSEKYAEQIPWIVKEEISQTLNMQL